MEDTLRKKLLESILFKEVSWFDRPENSVQQLTQVMTRDVSWLVDATLQREFLSFEIAWCVIAALLFGMYLCWQSAIFMTLMSPLLIFTVHDFKAQFTSD
mmetsp:Transcript_30914/g.38209  ORF Transcript_30914/g.38209 Transcript_30914/m.38209 type:complete len:100 (-) Transcript_30914:313-612(-)